MYSKEAFEAMTVVELRGIARENGVTLSAGISKQGIIERLCSALIKEETPAPQPAEPAPAVRRSASIVTDDEDTPVLTPNAPYSRSAAPRPASASAPLSTAPSPGQPTINRGNIPGTNKPVFSLEGVRAWHNPRTYQQPGTSSYSQHTNTYTQPRPQAPAGYGQQRPAQRPAPTVSRFGPDAVTSSNEEDAAQEPPRHTAYGAESRPAYGGYQSDYRARRDPAPTPAPAVALPELLASSDIIDDSGILEIQEEGHGYLRTGNYLPGPRDIYVSPAQIRRFHLQTGDRVRGKVRPRRENETHSMLLYITEINDVDAQDVKTPDPFESLTPVYPSKQIQLSKKAPHNALLRAIDLLSPIGFGQRAMIIAPPRCGKTALLTDMAVSIHAQYPDVQLMSLLLGERPEDITIARDALPGDVIYAGFNEPMENHVRTAALTYERAMRLAEQKKDVVLLVDSLTALCRACSECAPQSVRILSGGLAAGSLARPKRLFGAARSLREGGSLTIVAIMLADTGIPLDHTIAEEFRGTANMELYLNANGQIDYARSMTRNGDAMLTAEAREAMTALRSALKEKGGEAFSARLNDLLRDTSSNRELIKLILQNEF